MRIYFAESSLQDEIINNDASTATKESAAMPSMLRSHHSIVER